MDFRRILEDCDVAAARLAWSKLAPHLPQPKSDEDALITLHRARTEAQSVPFKKRAYSHRWLLDHGLPSGLPDGLRPLSERIYPKVAEAVGISVKARSEAMRPVAQAVERAMADAVAEAYSDGMKDPAFVRARMNDAKAAVLRGV